MNDITKKITPVNIEEELKRSYLDYAMSVIIGRALPDVRDGLKPVHRRVLFAMSVLGNDWNKPYKKSARVVGDVIGKYHPHGDTAVYDTIVRMAQSFSLRYMLVDGQGNFGSVDGDSAAAMRYTEVRLTKIAHEFLADLEKETVDYVPNYDNTEQIPDVMPTRILNLLVNGSSGIAVGMATNIPPHNLAEVVDGCIAYMDNENLSVEELMEHIQGPDFPTAAIINGKRGIEEAYRTGRGKIYIRARTEIETNCNNGRENIIVHEIPYQVNKARLIKNIADLVKEKRVEGISGLCDESDKDGMRIVIKIKRDAVGEIVLHNLYSLTQLQISFGINMVALHKRQPKILSLKDILSAFIRHRREVVTRRTIFELRKARDRAHLLEALVLVITDIDPIIELIRSTTTPLEAKGVLMAHSWSHNIVHSILKSAGADIEKAAWMELQYDGLYYLTEQQSEAILALRLQKLTSLEYKKLINEYNELINKIAELNLIIHNSDRLMEVIREEFLSIKEQYKDTRRTKIIDNNYDINVDNLINKEDVVVTLSYHGYIKYQPITDYEAQRRGGKGKSAASIKEDDFIDRLLVANTHDTILLFSSYGRMYWMKVYQLPEASSGSRGRPIINLLPLDSNERITAILPVRKYEEGHYVFMATASGTVKKTAIIDFSRPRSSGIIAINLNDGDKLIGVDITDGNNDIMLFTAYGKVVRFPENQVRSMGRTATGIRGIHLIERDRVVSLIVPREKKSILTVTQYGYGKRTAQEEYPTKSRATYGVISIKVSKRNGEVVGAVQVDDCNHIMIITDYGTLVRTRVSEVSIVGRKTKGVILIRMDKNQHVVGLQPIA
ncbi:DNA gyrase subunit A [secondary endosymbiont of Trabutina mannipara]|uniref:DNA gyrase subunit A n=1 Tax=secondary endosymbiont of Trabutina mannipara TaxID=1835721 RepID=A0A1C3L420_9ENTR|nr:DNA gyrase subunit A [secondary endosymbiont of Trabutina mannipara]